MRRPACVQMPECKRRACGFLSTNTWPRYCLGLMKVYRHVFWRDDESRVSIQTAATPCSRRFRRNPCSELAAISSWSHRAASRADMLKLRSYLSGTGPCWKTPSFGELARSSWVPTLGGATRLESSATWQAFSPVRRLHAVMRTTESSRSSPRFYFSVVGIVWYKKDVVCKVGPVRLPSALPASLFSGKL